MLALAQFLCVLYPGGMNWVVIISIQVPRCEHAKLFDALLI